MALSRRHAQIALLFILLITTLSASAPRPTLVIGPLCKKVSEQKELNKKKAANVCEECDARDISKKNSTQKGPALDFFKRVLRDDDTRVKDALFEMKDSPRLKELQSSALGDSIIRLVQNYSNKDTRRKHFKKYYQAIRETLALLPSGGALLKCYDSLKHPKLSRTEVYPIHALPRHIQKSPCDPEFDMAMLYDKDPFKPKSVTRTMLFNADTPPFLALISYSHELKHGCNPEHIERDSQSQQLAEEVQRFIAPYLEPKLSTEKPLHPSLARLDPLKQKLSDLAHTPEAAALSLKVQMHKKESTRERGIDEVRAFSMDNQIAQELASATPELFCSMKHLSGILRVEKRIADGSFPSKILLQYVEATKDARESDECKEEKGITQLLDEETSSAIEESLQRLPIRTFLRYSQGEPYQVDHVFEVNPRTNAPLRDPVSGLPVLLPSLRKPLEKEGYTLAPESGLKDKLLQKLKDWKKKAVSPNSDDAVYKLTP